MKRNLLTVLFSALAFTPLFAETSPSITDNFNSRPGTRLTEVKGFLQGQCWFFADFDINRGGWTPNIEGDGAMVSGTGASATERTGIYTPLLDLSNSTPISFTYSFNMAVSDRRWFKIVAIDGKENPIAVLDSVELTGSSPNHTYKYSKNFALAGTYKLYINYQGIGGSERIAIDQLNVGAVPHYASSPCNVAPVALRDKFAGTASHTASGNVLSNDYDPNHETMTAYLLSESPDGRVDLNKDGSFLFTPKDGYTGTSTQFSYKVCDDGSPSLCSITTTATIRFPSKSTLLAFQAMYSRKETAINWNTASDNHSKVFEVERSLDGTYYKKVGEVTAAEAQSGQYSFIDKMHEQERRNDLYYRLRQIDGANRVTYSKVLLVRSYGTRSVEAVSVTPDPSVNDIQVNVQLKEKSFVVMRVTDDNGSELIKQSAMGDNGSNMYDIEGTSQLQPGTYNLEVIINSNERLTMKLAKS
jgi:Bacterial Ig domain